MEKFSRKVQWDVKRSVYTASAFYFFYYGGKACLFPFISLYFRQMGMSASQTGLVFGVKSLLWYCASPVWMAIACRVQKTKTILCYSIFVAIGSNLALTLLPPADPEKPYQICLQESPAFLQNWYSDGNVTLAQSTEPGTAESTTMSRFLNLQTTVSDSLVAEMKFVTTEPGTSAGLVTTPMIKTTLASTELSKSSVGSTTVALSAYEMGMKLLPLIQARGFTSKNVDEIQKFIAEYIGTADWPKWKQRILKDKIIIFLTRTEHSRFEAADKHEDGDESSLGKNQDKVNQLALLLAKSLQTGESSPEKALDDLLREMNVDLSAGMRTILLQRLKQNLSQASNEALRPAKSVEAESTSVKPRGWSGRFGGRAKRDQQDVSNSNNHTSSLLDAFQSLNLTTYSEEKLKNLTKSLKNFAEELIPYLSSNKTLFICILIIITSGELLSAPVELLSDNSLYRLLDELDSLNQYGKHRIAALAGAASASISVCILVYYSPCYLNGSINRFHIHFYIFALLLGISFMLAPFYPSYDPVGNSTKSRISGTAKKKCLTCSSMICSSCRHFLLLVTVFIVGVSQAPVQNFILWTIQDMDGASELVYGCYVSANALCAMLSSLCARPLIKLLKPCTVGFISLMSIALQLLLYSFLPSPWLIVPLQLLNITGQSFLWAIVSHHTSTTMSSAYENSQRISEVHVFARASQQRSLHTAYVSIYQGLSFSVGSIISGFLYDIFNKDLTPVLVGGAVLVAVWGVLFATYQCCCLPRKLRRKYSHLVSDTDSEIDRADNTDFALKQAEKNGNYVSNYYNVRDGKKKKSNKMKKLSRFNRDSGSSSENERAGEADWLNAAMKKESRML